MELTIRQDAMTECFADTEKLIYHTLHQFIAAYGGDFTTLLEYTGEIFVSAFLEHDRRRSKFSTTLRWYLWHQLLDKRRAEAKHHARIMYCDLEPDLHVAKPTFNRFLFADELSQDARLVVGVVLDTPWQFDPDARTIRSILRQYLRGLGWSTSQIAECFAEIRQALQH